MEIIRIKNKKYKEEEEEEEEEEDYKIYGILFSEYNRTYDTTQILYEKKYASPMTNEDIESSKEIYKMLSSGTFGPRSLIYIYVYVEVAKQARSACEPCAKHTSERIGKQLTSFMWWPANELLIHCCSKPLVPWKSITSEK